MTESVSNAQGQGRADGRGPLGRALAFVEITALALTVGAGIAAWLVGIFTRGYDYDEVLRAHSIWLTSQGLRPYSDFFEVHPPYFVLLSPLMRGFTDPVEALRALRLAAAAGHFLFLGGLVTLGVMSIPPRAERRWAWLGIAVVAFQPPILDFLVEFRIDGWGYALIAWSTVLFRRRAAGVYRSLEFGALTAIASALLSPKMVLLPPLIVLFDGIKRCESRRGFVRAGLAYLVGVGLAAVGFALYLWANGIGRERIILLLGRYHAVSNTNAGFRYGLLDQILLMRPLLLLVGAGAVCGALGRVRRKNPTGPYEPALAVWLVSQMLLVTYPYKQYYAPWFLFASGFAPSLALVLASFLGKSRVFLVLLACAQTTLGSVQIARFWAAAGLARSEDDLIRWMNKVTRPEDRVVGSPPYHPIRRYDTFFLSFNTTDPKGFDSERIFARLPGLRPFVSEEHYRNELEAHPPALVVLKSPAFEVAYPALQKAVLEDYLSRRGYRTVRVGVVWFALRPDRYEDARRNGSLQ